MKEKEATAHTIKAEELAKQQKEISVSEFFAKNRHLLGFDNPMRALLMTVKEAVDNSLDACAEMKVLPEILVHIKQTAENRYHVSVEDNGPGIVKEQIPRVFGKLLYGSKFHHLRQSLTADEPIFIKRNNKVELIPIGEFVDHFLGKEKEEQNISFLDIQVPAFDPLSKKYHLRRVSHVIRHKRENEILKIRTEYNKEIKVTGCHSLFTYNQKTEKVESVEARSLKKGDYIVVPSKLPEVENIYEINVLEYLSYTDIRRNWFYVYGIRDIVKKLRDSAEIVHKKVDKSRRFYRVNLGGVSLDVLDDSMKQYITKGFLPLQMVCKLNLIHEVKEGQIVTYYHGRKHQLPVTLSLSKEFLRFLGVYIAEGHPGLRQLGLTFGKHEQALINEVLSFAQILGLGSSTELRERSIRVKLFNNLFVKFIKNVCGKGAFNKRIPEFVFRVNEDLRWHFIDGYCQGDGHKVKDRNSLMFGTKSKNLAIGLQYLFLMNGITSSYGSRLEKGLGKIETMTHKVSIYGSALDGSHVYARSIGRKKRRLIEYNSGNVLGVVAQELDPGDLAFVQIREVEMITQGYDYVYDLSVPGCENFVGGIGGIACHNSRGQQGIGISASVLYAQLTTGKVTKITSRTDPKKPAHYYELQIDTKRNEPKILAEKEIEWKKEHGTKVELELEGKYQKGKQSVDEFIKQAAIVNPHARFTLLTPDNEKIEFPRVINQLPAEAKEIKPHPYGIEVGTLIRMMEETSSRTLQGFLTTEFSRIGAGTAKEMCEKALLQADYKPHSVTHQEAERLFKAMQEVKVIAPPTDCLSPIGEEALVRGLKKEIAADFYTAVSRQPSVYRGFPFLIEVAIAYGGSVDKEGAVRLLRFANRVPLLYQQGACSVTRAVQETNWKAYGLQQSGDNLPVGPVAIVVHMASVWVPFTSEAKDAVAHYDEIIKEIKLAVQECGRKLNIYIRQHVRAREAKERVSLFEKYIPEVADALADLTGKKKEIIVTELQKILKKGMSDILAQANGEENGKGK